MTTTVSSHVPFKDLCNLCEKISRKAKKDKKKALSDFIAQWRDFHSKLHANDPNTVDSFYPAMRLILPHLERERSAYGIKETTLAKLYIEILCLAHDSEDAQKLLNYRTPKNAKAAVGDFASVAEIVLRRRCPEGGTLKISDVNEYLDNVAAGNIERNKPEVKKNLKKLLCQTSALEQKWVIRMILKEMKMGLNEHTVLNTYHPDAKDLYNVTSNLSKVCFKLKDPQVRLHEIEIALFSPFRPMLAAQASPDQIPKMMDQKSFLIETKYDGERMQLHKQDNIFKYFSRSGMEYSQSFGETPNFGSLTPYISKSFQNHVKTCILDGEMVGWNKKLGCIGTKGENFDVKSLSDEDDYQACFCIFDILYYNGKVLTDLSLIERLKYLDGLFTDIEGRILRTPQKEGLSKEDIISNLNAAIDNREEGIIVKSPSSIYKPNTRGWIKIKPEYMSNVMGEMDLLILGGYFGEGRRRGLLSHFLLGLAVSPNDTNEKPEIFYSFAKVGSGYSLQELYQLLGKMKDDWQVYEKQRPPASIILAPGHKEKPDLWIDPSKSQIVQVRAAEIINSDRFKTECTLRFPRVEKVRYDKPWHHCMTTKDLQELKEKAAGKLAFKHFVDESDDTQEPSPKKRGGVAGRKQEFKLGTQFAPANISGVVQESSLLGGKEMCIICGPSSHPKHKLETLITKFGGTFVQNPASSTFCILSDKMNIKTKNLIKSGDYDIVKTTWLLKCIENKKLHPWNPSDMWHCSKATAKELADDFDEYGDSYDTSMATVEELKSVFENISDEVVEKNRLTANHIADLEYEYFVDVNYNLGLFRICRVYIDDKTTIEDDTTELANHPLEFVKLILQYYGATMTSQLDKGTTHIIVHSANRDRLAALKQRNDLGGGRTRCHIVNEDWAAECVRQSKLLAERHFFP